MRRKFVWLLGPVLLAAAAAAQVPPNLPHALAAQRQLAELHPNDPAVLNDLGNLQLLAELPGEAEDTYRRAVKLDPELVSARFNLALLLHQTGRQRAATQQLRKVLDTDRRHAWSHYQLGTIFGERGRRTKAVRHYRRALTLDPRLADPAVNHHILVNELALPALLRAHSSSAGAAIAPRIYEDPGRITELFVPGISSAPAPAPAAMEPEPKPAETKPAEAKPAEPKNKPPKSG